MSLLSQIDNAGELLMIGDDYINGSRLDRWLEDF